jgi:hypothetical protein
MTYELPQPHTLSYSMYYNNTQKRNMLAMQNKLDTFFNLSKRCLQHILPYITSYFESAKH